MKRAIAVTAGVLAAVAMMHHVAGAQAIRQPSAAGFEAASVKPGAADQAGASFGLRPGGLVEIRNNTLRNMTRNAYGVQNFQIVGGPDWFDRDRFDVNARFGDANAAPQQILAAVQQLLADQFKLAVHRETRDVPIYALVLARTDGRLGAHISPAGADCTAIREALDRGIAPPAPGSGSPDCGTRISAGHLRGRGIRMRDLARNLSNFAGRLIVDKSGRSELFDLDLDWNPNQTSQDGVPTAAYPSPTTDAADLFTALQEELGLKLSAERGPAEVLVVDYAERPRSD